MDKLQIVIFAVVLAFAGARIYQKYFAKNKTKTSSGISKSQGAGFYSSSKDDDYEPYSKK